MINTRQESGKLGTGHVAHNRGAVILAVLVLLAFAFNRVKMARQPKHGVH